MEPRPELRIQVPSAVMGYTVLVFSVEDFKTLPLKTIIN